MNPCLVSPPRIFLIDDNAGDIRLITEALHAAAPGAEVRSICDGTLAIPGLEAALETGEAPNLVLLDLRMPKKDGLEILAEIKKDPNMRHLPVVILTSSEAPSDVFRAYALHANAVVTKPLGFVRLRSVLTTLCEFWLRVAHLPEAAYARHAAHQNPTD
jgi:chemotaxis family two-component system response regulator Rcp1